MDKHMGFTIKWSNNYNHWLFGTTQTQCHNLKERTTIKWQQQKRNRN